MTIKQDESWTNISIDFKNSEISVGTVDHRTQISVLNSVFQGSYFCAIHVYSN